MYKQTRQETGSNCTSISYCSKIETIQILYKPGEIITFISTYKYNSCMTVTRYKYIGFRYNGWKFNLNKILLYYHAFQLMRTNEILTNNLSVPVLQVVLLARLTRIFVNLVYIDGWLKTCLIYHLNPGPDNVNILWIVL